MKDFRVGYLYSLAPIHCGGEGDLGNILEIAREVHTNFPYVPGSSLRGSIRDEVKLLNLSFANTLFGKELDNDGQMGVHQVWFGDARLLWVPMRTFSSNRSEIFVWVSCHSLIRDWAIASRTSFAPFPNSPVGIGTGGYSVADANIQVSSLTPAQINSLNSLENWPNHLNDSVKPTWLNNRIILPDSDFQVLMEHSLWTQIRNKIQDQDKEDQKAGSAEVFWTDVCIPRDTIFYFPWGYNLLEAGQNRVTQPMHDLLMEVITGLIQVGGQANVGRGWVQSWVSDTQFNFAQTQTEQNPVGVA